MCETYIFAHDIVPMMYVTRVTEVYIHAGRPGGVSGYPRVWYRSVS